MIIHNINAVLTEKGFRKIGVNVNDIYLHCVEKEQGTYIVLVMNCPTGLEFTLEQYKHVREQIADKFQNRGNVTIRILSIICTNNAESVRRLYTEGEEQWIIDTANDRLILYESQSGEFLGLRNDIDKILLHHRVQKAEDEIIYSSDGMRRQVGYETNNSGAEPYYDSGVPVSREYTKRSFGKSYFTKCNTLLVIINVLVFLWLDSKGSSTNTEYLLKKGALYWPAIEQYKEYYRLITYMFLHSGFEHLANNMVVLLFVGDNLERAIGKWKYLLIYFACGVIAGIVSLSYNMLNGTNVVSVGASGAIFGVVGALAYIVIRNKGHLEDLSSMQIVLFVLFSLYGGLTSQGVDNAAHIGGLLAGVIITAILYRRPNQRRREGGIEL